MAQNRGNVGQIAQLASPLEKSNQGPKTSGQEVQPTSCTGAGVATWPDRIQIPFFLWRCSRYRWPWMQTDVWDNAGRMGSTGQDKQSTEEIRWFCRITSVPVVVYIGASVVHVDHNARVVCTRYTSMLISFWQGPCIYLQSTMQVRNFLQWVLLRI